ncbi:MAG: PCRF domain-containing protein [Candidatus Paceibacterota bacterium]
MREKDEINKELEKVEEKMNDPHFWDDKEAAQKVISRYQELKDELEGVGKYDKSDAIITIFGGAGGTDAEDFARMLLEMYLKFAAKKGWTCSLLHSNHNDHGGYRNVTVEVSGKNVFGTLQNESGVHRLVRISPFDSNKKRHTAFAMVEVVPKLKQVKDIDLDENEVRVEFSKSSGPGGQNVNKRETAVRVVHEPTDTSIVVSSERSQEQNRQKALEILRGKLYHMLEEERRAKEEGMQVSKTTDNEWGSQIRSYVLHPYKLVKDHRTNTEVRDVESVFEGDIEPFIEAMKES